MTNLEFENWRLTRARGWGRFLLNMIFKRCLLFSLPLAGTLGFARWRWGGDAEFWRRDQFLLWAFAAVAVLIGFGDGLFGWAMREREYARKLRFLHEHSPATAAILRSRGEYRASPGIDFNNSDDVFADDTLIDEAKSLQTAHTRGLVDLDEECAKFDPIFKMSLAKDTFCLAGRARLGEQAAFLALMSQFEN